MIKSYYELVIQVVGLDNSGKSTIIKCLNKKDKSQILPTTNISLTPIIFGTSQKKIIFLDCSGNGLYRDNWKFYFDSINALVYVIDITDNDRLLKSKLLFHSIIKELNDKNKNIPIMILLNKIDINKELVLDDIEKHLEIDKHNYKGFKIFFKNVSGLEGDNVTESFEYLINLIKLGC